MNYTVIARRWRPKTFEDVVGQPHVVTTLQNSIRRGRVAHAYLFSGPRGVGKTSISRILAKAVNCAEGVKDEPCNVCKSCVAIDAGGYVDVIEIDAASNRGIDEIRELRETVRYLPMEARYKVYIIDEAHMLTEPAFNALLKTLEEPPGHNIFVLATTESQKVPYTIMSRCQRFDFRRIGEPQIIEQLRRICIDEGIGYDEGVLNYVVREADGSLRDAESLLDQVIAYSGNHITEQDAIDVVGVVQRSVAYRIVKSIVEKDAKTGLRIIADTLDQGHDAYQIYKGLIVFLRDLLMIKVWEGKPPFVFMDEEEYRKVSGLLESVEYYEVQNMVHHLLQSEDLVRGMFPKVSLEVLFINLFNLSQLRDVESMLENLPAESAPPRAVAPAKTCEPEPIDWSAPVQEEPVVEPIRRVTEPATPVVEPSRPIPPAHERKAGTFGEYLKEKSKMLFGFLGSFEMTVEDRAVVIALDKRSAHVRNDAMIVGELKKFAGDFFGKEMSIKFIDAAAERVDTIDDYVKEAELLFKTVSSKPSRDRS
jgi:DNA polymerase III subunit gamma/tau